MPTTLEEKRAPAAKAEVDDDRSPLIAALRDYLASLAAARRRLEAVRDELERISFSAE